MKKQMLEQFKNKFLDQKKTILKQTANIVELDVDGDEMDLAQGNILNSIIEQLSKRNIKQLERIEKALSKIDDGTFGECEECGEPIPEKRLLAKPDADTCIVCAERLEYDAKQYAS